MGEMIINDVIISGGSEIYGSQFGSDFLGFLMVPLNRLPQSRTPSIAAAKAGRAWRISPVDSFRCLVCMIASGT